MSEIFAVMWLLILPNKDIFHMKCLFRSLWIRLEITLYFHGLFENFVDFFVKKPTDKFYSNLTFHVLPKKAMTTNP